MSFRQARTPPEAGSPADDRVPPATDEPVATGDDHVAADALIRDLASARQAGQVAAETTTALLKRAAERNRAALDRLAL